MSFRKVGVTPLPDAKRVKLDIELEASEAPPNLEIRIVDPAGETVAETFVVETPDERIELTLHLRGRSRHGRHKVVLTLGFKDEEPFARAEESFSIPSETQAEG